MREKPFKPIPQVKSAAATPPAPETTPTVNKSTFADSVVDLGAELQRPKFTPPPAPDTVKTEPKTESTAAPTEPAPDAKPGTQQPLFDNEGFEEFKKGMLKDTEEQIRDPKASTRRVLQFTNTLRFLIYPFIYRKIIFDGPEAADLDNVLKKRSEILRKNEKLDEKLNDYEKHILAKYEQFDQHKKAILWNDQEIEELTNTLEFKMMEQKFLRWLMANDWALVLIYIEGKRLGPVVMTRMLPQL